MTDDDDFDPWWREALCAEIGTNLFFLRAGEPGYEAKRACRLCPVRAKCLADSIKTEIPYGIFGGLGETARRPLTARVRAGEDPLHVATDHIAKETTDGRPADRSRRPQGGRGPGDRLRPAAPGRPQERPGLAAQRPRATGQ